MAQLSRTTIWSMVQTQLFAFGPVSADPDVGNHHELLGMEPLQLLTVSAREWISLARLYAPQLRSELRPQTGHTITSNYDDLVFFLSLILEGSSMRKFR